MLVFVCLCLSPGICHCISLLYLYCDFHAIFPKLPQKPALTFSSKEDSTDSRHVRKKILLNYGKSQNLSLIMSPYLLLTLVNS